MQSHIRVLARFIAAPLIVFFSLCAAAQTSLPPGVTSIFIPAQPSSADTIYLKIPRVCSDSVYEGATYRTSTSAGKIRVEVLLSGPPPCPFGNPAAPDLVIEIGRLPAGTYALDVLDYFNSLHSSDPFVTTVISNMPLTVTDGRAAKTAPAVRLNYSDHWWDPTNSGSGLFIYQDANDQLLGAWFTYGADGKAIWYTIQLGSWVTATRYEGKLMQTSRPASPNGQIDTPAATAVTVAGNAILDFSGADGGAITGVFTVKFAGSDTVQTRNIRRFGK